MVADEYTVLIDYDDRQYEHMLRAWTWKQFRILATSLVLIAAITLGAHMYFDNDSFLLWCFGFTCGALAITLASIRSTIRQGVHTRRLTKSGATEMRVSPYEIAFKGRYHRTELDWPALARVEQFRDFWSIYLIGGRAILIPGELLTTEVRTLLLSHVKRFREPRDTCLRCGYDLFGLAESRCPECGLPFDPPKNNASENSEQR